MDITIEIGRDVEGEHVFRVPSSFKAVSRQHATLYWCNGVATIEDKSSNGTFVNGHRITKTTVTENDTIWLGRVGPDERCYKLDLKKVLASFQRLETDHTKDSPQQAYGVNYRIREAENTHSDNYAKEFVQLKRTYIDYHEQLSKLKSKSNMRMQLPRLLLSLIPAVLGVIFMFVLGFGSMGFIAMMLGSVLSGVIGTLTMGRNTSRQEKLSEDILDLQLKYQKDYKCPKCGKQYSLDLHWKKLQADGKCPFGCGAQFV